MLKQVVQFKLQEILNFCELEKVFLFDLHYLISQNDVLFLK